MTEFIFPVVYSDIVGEVSDNRYRVESPDTTKNMDERRAQRILTEIETALHQDISIIMEPDRFDYCYFFIKQLEEQQDKMKIGLVEKLADVLSTGLSKVISQIEDTDENLANNEKNTLRNSFKMLLFLNFYFLNATCVKKAKNTIADQISLAMNSDNANNAGRGGKKGKNNRKNDLANEYVEMVLEKQKGILVSILDVLDIQFIHLWNKKNIDEEFYKYFVEIAVKMLESRQLLKKYESIKNQIFDILESIVQIKPETVKNVQIKLINLIYEEEALVENVVDFVLKAQRSNDSKLSSLTTDTIILLTNYVNQITNVNAESQAIKNVKEFLIQIAEKLPKLFYTNLSVFIKLYDNEAYHLRNAISEIIGRIIKYVLTSQNQDDDMDEENQKNQMKQKRKLLETLITRIYDKHAYSRANVLGVLAELCEGNTIPGEFLSSLLKCGCDRIKDQSANVRKRAITLIYQVMRLYYYILVENNKDSNGKFTGKEKIIKDMKYLQQDKKEFIEGLQEIEQQLDSLTEDQGEKFDELQENHKFLKRKLDSLFKIESTLNEYGEMIQTIEDVNPNLIQLLGSKSLNDVIETMKLYLYLYKSNIECAHSGIKKMLVLIWSREKTIKDELIKTYWALFFNDKEYTRQQVGKNIISLFQDSSLGEITSLEEMLGYIINWNNFLEEKDREKKKNMFYIHTEVFKHIWDIFRELIDQYISNENFESENLTQLRSSLSILRICAPYKKQIFNSEKYISFVEILKVFLKNNKPDWIIIQEISKIVECVKEIKPEYQNMFIKLLVFLLIKYQGTQDSEYYIALESIINMIFMVKQSPEKLCEFLLLKLTKSLIQKEDLAPLNLNTQNSQNVDFPTTPIKNKFSQDGPNSAMRTPTNAIEDLETNPGTQQLTNRGIIFERKLGHLLFSIGHIALKLILLVDNIESELKKLKIEGERRQDEKNQSESQENNELDKVYGGFEAEFEKEKENLHRLSEKTILDGENLLAQFKPWILRIVNDMLSCEDMSTRNQELDKVAVLTLCKFMCTSSKFCSDNLSLIFKILVSDADEIIKTNVIVSLGDLLHKYHNLLTPFIDNVYQNLQDKNLQVRKTTMMVLTHLILNDMMKIKGEICEVALLLEDDDEGVVNLVKLFLHELHKKDPKLIYNMLPEAIGKMSNAEKTHLGSEITEQSFVTFAKNIMPYLEKGSEALIEKLVNRLQSKNIKEQRNVSFCLSQLTFNDKGVRILLDTFETYREKLEDETIQNNFKNIVTKLKKIQRQEIKPLVEEFESKVLNYKTETFDQKRLPTKKKKQRKGKKGGRKGRKDSKDDNEDEDDSEGGDQPGNLPPSSGKSKRNMKKRKPRAGKMQIESEDSQSVIEESDELDEEDEEEEMIPVKKKRGGRR